MNAEQEYAMCDDHDAILDKYLVWSIIVLPGRLHDTEPLPS